MVWNGWLESKSLIICAKSPGVSFRTGTGKRENGKTGAGRMLAWCFLSLAHSFIHHGNLFVVLLLLVKG
jgi:hypothetical protein